MDGPKTNAISIAVTTAPPVRKVKYLNIFRRVKSVEKLDNQKSIVHLERLYGLVFFSHRSFSASTTHDILLPAEPFIARISPGFTKFLRAVASAAESDA